MSEAKKPRNAVVQHHIGLTIQYEPQGHADVAALMERVKKCREIAYVDEQVTDARGAPRQSTYRAYLRCRNADAIVRKIRAGLALATEIRRVLMRIEYGTGSTAPRALVNLVG